MKHDNTKTQTDDEDAVSPVIGVILMVAITVILAAVIGTFVLGLGSNVQENVQAGVNVDYSPSDAAVTATYVSEQNADIVNVTFSNSAKGSTVKANMSTVGDKLEVTANDPAGSSNTVMLLTGNALPYNNSGSYDFSGCSGSSCTVGSNWATGDAVSVTVTAVSGDQSTVVLTKEGSI